MSTRADATFVVKSWDEKPYHEAEGEAKLTRATVAKSFSGDLEGEGVVEYLMCHGKDGTASFVGLERIEGTLGGRSGSFILEHRGTFAGGTADTKWTVVPGSGSGELDGLQGEGGFASAHAESYEMVLDYEFKES